MDLQQARILLKKINTLNDSLTMDNGPIASIERDLMLSYVRQLYEAYLDTSSGNGQSTAKRAVSAVKAQLENVAPELEIVPPPAEPEPAAEAPRRKYTPPRIIEIPETAPAPEPVKVHTPPPPPPPPVEKTVAQAPQPAPVRTSSGSADPRIRALFDEKQARELSEKLSLQPLRDLTKGLSINDRLLYTNDLFNKDTNLFNAALKQLNDMRGMEEARPFLEDQAARFNWTESEKADVAMDFIKHVRRRYV